MQAVGNNENQFRVISIGFSACVHDATVFTNSSLSDTFDQNCGDGGYPCSHHVLDPSRFRDNLTEVEKNHNRELSFSKSMGY